MTDRLSAFIVVLESDMREDDAQAILDAIGMIRGVHSVEPHVSDVGELVSRSRIKHEILNRLMDMVQEH